MSFVECETCAAKPGSPSLCAGCIHNRDVIARLNDWKSNISNIIKSAPEFASGQWAGDKDGWGYHFEIVAYVMRERQRLTAEVVRAQCDWLYDDQDQEEGTWHCIERLDHAGKHGGGVIGTVGWNDQERWRKP